MVDEDHSDGAEREGQQGQARKDADGRGGKKIGKLGIMRPMKPVAILKTKANTITGAES